MNLHLLNTGSSDFIQQLRAIEEKKTFVSKSYTKDMMALYISDVKNMGVDIELKTERSPQVIAHFIEQFATFEIKDVPKEPDSMWFYKAWTAMESYFKLEGTGFRTPKNFTLDLEQKAILRAGNKVAELAHFDIGVYMICLCSRTPFAREDIQINNHGWGEG